MNIFYTDTDPVVAARNLCDKHVCKMAAESGGMLVNCIPEFWRPHGQSHQHHPCSRWVALSGANYQWLLTHAFAICDEYYIRYGWKKNKQTTVVKHGKFSNHAFPICDEYYFLNSQKESDVHGSLKWIKFAKHSFDRGIIKFELDAFTPPAQAMPEIYKQENVVEAYRQYYIHEKKFAKWQQGRMAPDWMPTIENK